jgi:hypothetical protein
VGGELLRASTIPEKDRHFLGKPFKPSELIARFREILAKKQGAGASPSPSHSGEEAAHGGKARD